MACSYAKGSLGTDVLCLNTGWVGDGTWEELPPCILSDYKETEEP